MTQQHWITRSRRTDNRSDIPTHPNMEALLSKLIELQTSNKRNTFNPPTYAGDTDVKLFISQFLEISETNEW